MEKKYKAIKSKNMANALLFLGFKYYKFDTPTGNIYSFEETEELLDAFNTIMKLKLKYNN